jgi:predicted lipid carrier protein YhbT
VTVIHGDVEAGLTLKEQVDVIVSDCLGPMLLGGGMLRALAVAK